MNRGFLIRLAGITAHFRDPRYNTGKIGKAQSLPIRTLHCPPPCTIHGLLCSAKGGWVEPGNLLIGWRMEFDSIGMDFQTCRLPKRKEYGFKRGVQKVVISPRIREFLAFPMLTIFAVDGVEPDWFRSPANPLSLGRSEDLVTESETLIGVDWSPCDAGRVQHQCLPLPLGFGLLYSAPVYFDGGRRPVGMSPKIDARAAQDIRTQNLARVGDTDETFFLWNFADVTR